MSFNRKCSCGRVMTFSLDKRLVICRHVEYRGGDTDVYVHHTYIPNDGKRPGHPHRSGRGYKKGLATP